MWIINANDDKADHFRKLLYQYTSLRFHPQTKYKMNVDISLKGNAYEYLKKDVVDEFLIARPNKLLKLHKKLMENIATKGGKIKPQDKKFIAHLFSYNRYIMKNKKMSYELAHLLNINTCTYCNRQYTMTVNETRGRKKVEHLIRPEFDHWFSQKDYPDLALSFYNLIPSCHICNSNLKRDKAMRLNTHIHPYVDTRAGFKFSYVPIPDGYALDVLRDDGVDNYYYQRVLKTLDMFKIPHVYGAHSNMELKDLLALADANHPDYIYSIVTDVMANLDIREEDAYRLLFGIDVREDHYLDRPMSKFKSDILRKIKEDYRKEKR